MRSLIVPAAGLSTRFPNMRPKWLLTHPDGRLVIDHVISSIAKLQFDRIILTILKKHQNEYDVATIIQQLNTELQLNIELCVLETETAGPADTVYQTLIKFGLEGEFLVRDCDNVIAYEELHRGNYVVGIHLENHDFTNIRNKSYIILNNENMVDDIIEKKVVSNVVSLGVYSFNDAKEYLAVYKEVSNLSPQDGKEIYLSHIISYMINMGQRLFNFHYATRLDDWGTLAEWNRLRENHKTYFVDVDGVLYQNSGKYGLANWDNYFEKIESNFALLKKLGDAGAQVILVTSRPEKYRHKIEQDLLDFGIKTHAFITNCHHSTRVIINDFAPSNPYPSCEAVSLPRNGKLTEYIRIP
jgi:NDP-sugar pyrophosphorylase family protein